MRHLLISLLFCLCFVTAAQADPITIGGTAQISNFVSVFRWDALGPQVSFDVLNTSPAAELCAIQFTDYELDGDLLLPLAPGESRSFSLTVLHVLPPFAFDVYACPECDNVITVAVYELIVIDVPCPECGKRQLSEYELRKAKSNSET